jgi:hypothetical protein
MDILCPILYVICMKYKHDINEYKRLRNMGMTWLEIAESLGVNNNSSIIRWVSRNYIEKVKYDYEKRPKK